MKYLLQRFSDNRDSTLGLLFKYIQSGSETKLSFQGYTLEDQYQGVKVSKETRIPSGFYELILQKTETPLTLKYRAKYPWFKYHIWLKNVPGFQGVYIHIGNTDEHTDACILVGDSADNNAIAPGTISSSTNCFRRLYKPLLDHLESGEKVFIQIRDEITML
jgi:hypothetical protein